MKTVNTKIRFIFSFVLVTLLMTSCFKREEYPPEPIISDPVFYMSTDSARLTFSFTDGDGDIGLAAEDTLSPFNPANYYHYNLYIDYYEKDDVDGWVNGTDLDGEPIAFTYRLNPIVVKGKAVGIKGTMDVYMNTF